MKNKKIICPNCNEEIFFNFDSYGYTPFHLHCKKCKINIGSTSFKICKELFKEFHEKETLIEYYKGKIQLLIVQGKELINVEQ